MRKIIVYIAVSADGFIARPDGDVGWLDRPDAPGDYGMAEFYATVDTVLLGRKTYEKGKELGQDGYEGKTNYVFSHSEDLEVGEGIERVAGDVGDFARRLRAKEGQDIWLVGGAELTAAFLDAGEVDEFILHVIPVLIGEGLPLVAPHHREVPLDLLDTHAYPDGVLRLRYAVRG